MSTLSRRVCAAAHASSTEAFRPVPGGRIRSSARRSAPSAGGRFKLRDRKCPKTSAIPLGPAAVECAYFRCGGCGNGACPLDERLQLEAKSLNPGTELMTSAEMGSRRAEDPRDQGFSHRKRAFCDVSIPG